MDKWLVQIYAWPLSVRGWTWCFGLTGAWCGLQITNRLWGVMVDAVGCFPLGHKMKQCELIMFWLPSDAVQTVFIFTLLVWVQQTSKKHVVQLPRQHVLDAPQQPMKCNNPLAIMCSTSSSQWNATVLPPCRYLNSEQCKHSVAGSELLTGWLGCHFDRLTGNKQRAGVFRGPLDLVMTGNLPQTLVWLPQVGQWAAVVLSGMGLGRVKLGGMGTGATAIRQ